MSDASVWVWGVSLLLALVLAPLQLGVIAKVKSFFGGRRGPSVLQWYHDLWKLLRKESVCSSTSAGLVRLAPPVGVASCLCALSLLPLGFMDSPLGFTGDIIVFLYLLGIGRLALVLGALDTGSSFEGMGASRELHFSALAEMAIVAVVVFLVMLTHDYSLGGVLNTAGTEAWRGSGTSLILIVIALLLVTLAENCRVPFDDPETHLELTMMHEAMVLDHAGPDLALIHYGAALKLWVFAAFLTTAAVPGRLFACPWTGLVVHVALVFVVSVAVGVIESAMARYRFLKVPYLLLTASAMAAMAIFLLEFGG